MAELLVRAGADVNSTDSTGSTPLHYCACEGTEAHIAVASSLLQNKADPNLRDNAGKTAADLARKHANMIIVLEENGAQVKITEKLATAGPAVKRLKLALGQRRDEVVNWKDKAQGRTLLHFACGPKSEKLQRPSLVTANLVLEANADVNATTKKMQTPLHLCALFGTAEHEAVATFLLECGADSSLKDTHGRTPLETARKKGHAAMVDLLEERADKPQPDQVQPPSLRRDSGFNVPRD